MKKRIIAFLLAAVLSLSFISCEQSSEDPANTQPSTSGAEITTGGTPGGTPDGGDVIKKSELGSFKLVYFREIEEEASVAMNKLVDKINSVCETKLTVTNDYILENDKNRKEWEHEILVGPTNREESAAFGADYRPYDYGYGYLDGKIVIYGESDAFLAAAINAFLLNVVVKNSKSDVFYQSDWKGFVSYNYNVPRLTVNGVDISGYEIVYPAAPTLFEKELADRLQCYITEMTGVELPVKKDSEARETQNAFLIGKTAGSEGLAATVPAGYEGIVNSNGTDIVVYGATMTGTVNAAKHLTDLMFDAIEIGKERTVTVNGETKVAIPEDHYSTMTFNVYTANQTEVRKDRVINTIMRYLPDTVGFQESDGVWMNEYRMRLSSYYELVGEGREEGGKGDAVPILYAKERFNLLESGTKWFSDTPDVSSMMPGAEYLRNYTWVLLEDKETKERYLHLNTHLDTAGSKIRYAEVVMLIQFLQQYNDVAVVLTGDMNARIDSEELKLIQAYQFGTVLDFPNVEGQNAGKTQIDWVMLTSDCLTMTKHICDNALYNGKYASDHYAFYVEFDLNFPENGRIDHNWDVEPSNYPDEWVDVSTDKIGAFYGPPCHIGAADRLDDGTVVIPEGEATVEIEGKTYVVIRSVEELNEALAADTARLNSYILDADLDYTGKTFNRIALNQGIFDGNGHKMFGYELVDQDNGEGKGKGTSTFAGVSADSNITVRNVTLGTPEQHIPISSTFSGSAIGAVLAYSNCTHTIENVTAYADITSTNVNVGGLAGNIVNQLTMKNCKFYGSINDTTGGTVGGLIGKVNSLTFVAEGCENHATVQALTYAGGLAGTAQGNSNVTLKNCVNYGAISNAKQAGGMIANLNYKGALVVENCINRGSVSGTTYLGGMLGGFVGTLTSVTLTNCTNYGEVSGTGRMGGMIGYYALEGASGETLLVGCVNYGSISGNSNVGGLVGGLEKTTPKVTLKNSANHGNVSGSSTAGIIGGIAMNGPLTVENCLNTGAVTGTTHTGAMVGYFKDCETTVTGFANIGSINGKWAGGIIGSTVPGAGTITLTDCISAGMLTAVNRTSVVIANQTGGAPVVSGLMGVGEDKNALTEIERTTVTAEEAVAWLNTKLADTFGRFLLDSEGVGAAIATPALIGVQMAASEGAKGEFRLIGSILGNTQRYLSVGFEIVQSDGTTLRLVTEKLHRNLASYSGGESPVATPAAALGGTFIYGVEVGGLVPTEGTVTFTVTAIGADLDGETVHRGTTYLVTFTDGDFVSAVMETK